MTYWKATRPDGRDFYSGAVDYAAALASGEPTPALSGTGPFPGPGWYHLATVPTDCVGMEWPCRLFEVEPADDLGDGRPRHLNKVGAISMRVLREVPAHLALGPQGKQVSALIDRAGALTQQDLSGAFAARAATWDATWDATWVAARGAARDAARDAARGAAWDAALVAARDAAWDAALVAARGAAWGAARALVSRDLIGHHPGWNQGEYDRLTGPWRSAIGPIHPDDPDWTETP